MATKNYMINDKWLDLDKQNIVELQSVDGVLDSLKVNGSEIETPSGKITITENGTDIDIAQYALADVNVEGGGGSSDFSTAEVTIVNNSVTAYDMGVFPHINPGDYMDCQGISILTETLSFVVVLYKNNALMWSFESQPPTASDIVIDGNASYEENDCAFLITGDCTITIS